MFPFNGIIARNSQVEASYARIYLFLPVGFRNIRHATGSISRHGYHGWTGRLTVSHPPPPPTKTFFYASNVGAHKWKSIEIARGWRGTNYFNTINIEQDRFSSGLISNILNLSSQAPSPHFFRSMCVHQIHFCLWLSTKQNTVPYPPLSPPIPSL